MFDLPPCVDDIAVTYGVEQQLIAAISIAEGGKLGQKVGPVKGGYFDHGPMQINGWWFDIDRNPKHLQQWGITKDDVLSNECTNYAVGTWILRLNYDWLGNWYDAVASYNAGSNTRAGYPYAERVMGHYIKMGIDQ